MTAKSLTPLSTIGSSSFPLESERQHVAPLDQHNMVKPSCASFRAQGLRDTQLPWLTLSPHAFGALSWTEGASLPRGCCAREAPCGSSGLELQLSSGLQPSLQGARHVSEAYLGLFTRWMPPSKLSRWCTEQKNQAKEPCWNSCPPKPEPVKWWFKLLSFGSFVAQL